MKYIKTFESHRKTKKAEPVNEELLGMPSLKDVKAKAQAWIEANKSNPEFKEALDKARAEMKKLDPSTQSKLKELSKETPEEIKAFGRKNALPKNVIYKMLEKYHYLRLYHQLKDILEDGEVTDSEIQSIKTEKTNR